MTARVIAFIVVGLFCAGVLFFSCAPSSFATAGDTTRRLISKNCAGSISNMDRNKTVTIGSNGEHRVSRHARTYPIRRSPG